MMMGCEKKKVEEGQNKVFRGHIGDKCKPLFGSISKWWFWTIEKKEMKTSTQERV